MAARDLVGQVGQASSQRERHAEGRAYLDLGLSLRTSDLGVVDCLPLGLSTGLAGSRIRQTRTQTTKTAPSTYP